MRKFKVGDRVYIRRPGGIYEGIVERETGFTTIKEPTYYVRMINGALGHFFENSLMLPPSIGTQLELFDDSKV